MIISKKAINDFLFQEMEDYSFLKKVSKKELRKNIKKLKGKFTPKTKPFLHQLVCFYIGVCLPSFLFFLDMGLGKTKIALDILAYRYHRKQIKKALILVPTDVNVEGWEEEVGVHSQLEACALYGSTKERKALLEEDAQFFILTYVGFMHLVCSLQFNPKKNKNNFAIDKQKMEEILSYFQAIVLDECHETKNPDSLTFKMLNKAMDNFKYSYLLTGTPFGKDPADLWAQFFLIDRGETLGPTMGLLRKAFFRETVTPSGFKKWGVRERRKDLFHKRIQNRSIRYEDRECSDLPEKKVQKVSFTLPTTNLEYYEKAILGMSYLEQMKRSPKETKNRFNAMRQVSSGFLIVDSHKKEYLFFKENPKLTVLQELVLAMPSERKMVIFYEFNASGDLIEKMLKENKILYSVVRGGGKKGGNVKNIKEWKKNPEKRILVANWKSASVGGNFQIGNYCVFYESPTSPLKRKQCMKRIHRTNQKRKTFFYDLVVQHSLSIERKILSSIEEGEDLFKCLIDGSVTEEDFLW